MCEIVLMPFLQPRAHGQILRHSPSTLFLLRASADIYLGGQWEFVSFCDIEKQGLDCMHLDSFHRLDLDAYLVLINTCHRQLDQHDQHYF